MPPFELATKAVGEAAAHSGILSRLLEHAGDLLTGRVKAPAATMDEVDAHWLQRPLNQVLAGYHISDAVNGNRASVHDLPSALDKIKPFQSPIGYADLPISRFSVGFSGGATKKQSGYLSIQQGIRDGSHYLYASQRLPANWRVSVREPESAGFVNVTNFINGTTGTRARIAALFSPTPRRLAVSPGMEVRLSVLDGKGEVGMERHIEVVPIPGTRQMEALNLAMLEKVAGDSEKLEAKPLALPRSLPGVEVASEAKAQELEQFGIAVRDPGIAVAEVMAQEQDQLAHAVRHDKPEPAKFGRSEQPGPNSIWRSLAELDKDGRFEPIAHPRIELMSAVGLVVRTFGIATAEREANKEIGDELSQQYPEIGGKDTRQLFRSGKIEGLTMGITPFVPTSKGRLAAAAIIYAGFRVHDYLTANE